MQLYWVGPLIGGMLSGFTYEYIKSTNHPDDNQSLKSSFRRKPKQKQKQSTHQQATLRRDHFSGGVTSNETELTITSNDIQRY